jgi:hypothetical protein
MSMRESTRSVRPRPTWAWCVLLAAIGGTAAWANFVPGPCTQSFQNWAFAARGLANHSAVVSLSVDLYCKQVPKATDPCNWCAGYVVEGWAGPIDGWVKIRDESYNPATVVCGSAITKSIMTTFNGTINPGQYRARGWLWDGTCDNEIDEEMYQVVPFIVPLP